ncbi:MAG: 3-phosphoshikimate 1-carboxyvinyltransferase [Gammaproteobacteria bacterium]|nr:3-phosphoshikimate 1-carboxyvinyltransferase [Gammaproteobacteria bacterium]|tara:strand:+ start:400 stop:1707 length:1308 start_codon:yes stop_codon:yes gene_type:complete
MMDHSHSISINDSNKLSGKILIPGDKSITHRSIILSSLCEGKTKIYNYLDSDDCNLTILAMKSLGVNITKHPNYLSIEGKGLKSLKKPAKTIDAGNSGTLARLLVGVLAMQPFSSKIIGDSSLSERPMERIIEPLSQMGANIISKNGTLPLNIEPSKKLHNINYFLKIASAQIKSCILLASLYVEGESIIEEIVNTRNHTENLLQHLNYDMKIRNKKISIIGQQKMIAKDIYIPSDISSAAFFIVATLITDKSELILKNIGLNYLRTGIIDVLIKMGAQIEILNESNNGYESFADIKVKSSKLKPIQLSGEIVSRLIDEFPILFIACSICNGVSEIKNIQELRFKESDRIKSMELGLNKLGINVKSTKDSIKIQGGTIQGGIVDSCNDHRVAMSFLIAGLVSKKPITVTNTSNINTSFPTFFSILKEQNVGIYKI